MSIDLQDIADQITNNTPRDAAVMTARLLRAVMGALPSRGQGEFISTLRAELAKSGYRFEADSRIVRFSMLEVGDQFKRLDGKRYSKIKPIKEIIGPERDEVIWEAYDEQQKVRVFVDPGEMVEKLDRSLGGTIEQLLRR